MDPHEKSFLFDFTPLHWAADYSGNAEVFKELLAKGADINAKNSGEYTPIVWAALYSEHPHVIKILLSAGANLDYPEQILSHAVRKNPNLPVIVAILDAGPDTDFWDEDVPILLFAAYNPNPAVVDLLVARGADVNTRSGRLGYSPLHYFLLKSASLGGLTRCCARALMSMRSADLALHLLILPS